MDWRLALDVADLISSGTASISATDRWRTRLPLAWRGLGQEFVENHLDGGFEAVDHENYPLTIIAAPPLADRRRQSLHPDLAEAVDSVEALGRKVFVCSYFDVVHRPWWVVAKGIEELA
jgi:hypothetical protein